MALYMLHHALPLLARCASHNIMFFNSLLLSPFFLQSLFYAIYIILNMFFLHFPKKTTIPRTIHMQFFLFLQLGLSPHTSVFFLKTLANLISEKPSKKTIFPTSMFYDQCHSTMPCKIFNSKLNQLPLFIYYMALRSRNFFMQSVHMQFILFLR